MTAADKAKLLALADAWMLRRGDLIAMQLPGYTEGLAGGYEVSADELRALVAEIAPEPEDNDDGTQRSNGA